MAASDDDAEVIAFEVQPVPQAQLVPVVCEAKLFCCVSFLNLFLTNDP